MPHIRRIVILALLAVCCSCRKAEESSTATSRSQHERTPRPVGRSYYLKHDFGEVDRNKSITGTIRLKNDDGEPIVLEESRTDCACLSVKSMPKRIEPGETGVFEVALNTTGIRGSHQVMAVFWSAGPKSYVVRLRAAATIRSCWTTPGEVVLGRLVAGEPVKHDLFVDVAGYPDAEVQAVSTDAEWITLKQKQVTTSPELRAKGIKAIACYEVGFDGSDATPGILSARIVVRVNTDREETLEVPVTGYFTGHVAVTPPVINFGIVRKTEAVRRCTLKFGHSVDAAKVEATASHPCIEVSVAEDGSTPNQLLMTARACLSGQMPEGKLVEGSIVGSDDAGIAIFRVPYTGIIDIAR